MEKLPLPSFNLLKKIQRGGIDAVKAIQRLLQQRAVSKDSVLLVDEMYLDKCEQYSSGKMVGADAEGNLYKGIVSFGLDRWFREIYSIFGQVKSGRHDYRRMATRTN